MSPAARGIASAGGLIWVVDFSGAIVAMTTAGVQTPARRRRRSSGGRRRSRRAGAVLESARLPAARRPPGRRRAAADDRPAAGRPVRDRVRAGRRVLGRRVRRRAPGARDDRRRGHDARRAATNSPREITTGPGNTLWVSLELSNKVARITGVDPPAPPVVPPPAPPAAPPLTPPVVATDRTAPVITRLRISPPRFRRASGNKAAAKVSMTLSEAATVRFTAERVRVGRRVAGKCVAPTARNRVRTLCVRTTPAGGAVSLAPPSGASVSDFFGSSRAGAARRSLPPGGCSARCGREPIALGASELRTACREGALTLSRGGTRARR